MFRPFIPYSFISVQPVLKRGVLFKNNKDSPTGLFSSVLMPGSARNIDLVIGLGASTSLGTLYCGIDHDSSFGIIEEKKIMLGVEDFYTRMSTYHNLLFVFFHEVWKAVTMYTQVVHPRKSWPWMDTVILPSAQDLADPSVSTCRGSFGMR